MDFDEKVLAAASIAFVRKINKVFPIWNGILANLSGFEEIDLKFCLDIFLSKFTNSF